MSAAAAMALEEIMPPRLGTVDPAAHPDEEFDLYSIPAFDAGEPEVAIGRQIGSAKQIVKPGDVLLSRIVPHIRRAWVVGDDRGRRIIASSEWIVFRGPSVVPHYLRHVLVGDPFHAEFMHTVSGVGGSLLRARPAYVAKIRIPLPTLLEQRRVAEILDKADALRAKRRTALAQLDRLTQSIFLDMFGDPATNPKGLLTSNIDGIAEQVTDGEHLTPERTTEGIKLLSARNVRDGYIDFENVDYIGIDEYERIRRRCNPSRGDILISCSGTIGRVASVETDECFSLVRSAALVRPKSAAIRTKFLEHYLRTPALKARMLRRANASSQANLFQGQIRELPVFVPPVELQDTFVRTVARVESLKAIGQGVLAELEALFASLQHRAFREEL